MHPCVVEEAPAEVPHISSSVEAEDISPVMMREGAEWLIHVTTPTGSSTDSTHPRHSHCLRCHPRTASENGRVPQRCACRRCGRTGRHWGRQISITVVTPVNCPRAGGPEESDSEHLSVVFPPSGAATTATATREARTVSGEGMTAVAAGRRERNEGSYDWGGSALKQEGSLCKAACGQFYAKTMSKSIFLFFVL